MEVVLWTVVPYTIVLSVLVVVGLRKLVYFLQVTHRRCTGGGWDGVNLAGFSGIRGEKGSQFGKVFQEGNIDPSNNSLGLVWVNGN